MSKLQLLEILPGGIVAVRVLKMIGGQEGGWHRTAITLDQDAAAHMAVVNEHLAQLGFDPVTDIAPVLAMVEHAKPAAEQPAAEQPAAEQPAPVYPAPEPEQPATDAEFA